MVVINCGSLQCSAFLWTSVKHRSTLAPNNTLSFSCLQIVHMSQDCTMKLKSNKKCCKKSHNALPNIENSEKVTGTIVGSTIFIDMELFWLEDSNLFPLSVSTIVRLGLWLGSERLDLRNLKDKCSHLKNVAVAVFDFSKVAVVLGWMSSRLSSHWLSFFG